MGVPPSLFSSLIPLPATVREIRTPAIAQILHVLILSRPGSLQATFKSRAALTGRGEVGRGLEKGRQIQESRSQELGDRPCRTRPAEPRRTHRFPLQGRSWSALARHCNWGSLPRLGCRRPGSPRRRTPATDARSAGQAASNWPDTQGSRTVPSRQIGASQQWNSPTPLFRHSPVFG